MYRIRVDGSGRVSDRNRQFLRQITPQPSVSVPLSPSQRPLPRLRSVIQSLATPTVRQSWKSCLSGLLLSHWEGQMQEDLQTDSIFRDYAHWTEFICLPKEWPNSTLWVKCKEVNPVEVHILCAKIRSTSLDTIFVELSIQVGSVRKALKKVGGFWQGQVAQINIFNHFKAFLSTFGSDCSILCQVVAPFSGVIPEI